MRADWDARGLENARHHVNTDEHHGFDFAWSGCRKSALRALAASLT